MSQQHKKVKSHLCKRGVITNRLSRMRHFRGHGVHSPYIYIMVRKILLHHNYDVSQFDAITMAQLQDYALSEHRAKELLAIAQYCKYSTFSFDACKECDIVVLSSQCSNEEVANITEWAKINSTAVAIIKPYKRKELCDKILEQLTSTSIDRYDYLLLLNNYLPKQHFRL